LVWIASLLLAMTADALVGACVHRRHGGAGRDRKSKFRPPDLTRVVLKVDIIEIASSVNSLWKSKVVASGNG